MSKIVLLNDTHFGHKGDNPHILEYFISFFEKQLFPYLEQHGIKTVVHAGDLFDRRKYVNFKTLREINKRVFRPLLEKGIEIHIVAGNHDTYFRNSNELNSLDDLLAAFPNWKVYTKPETINLNGYLVAMLPWIYNDGEVEAFEFVDSTDAKILVGHLELAGFQSMRGNFIEMGLKRDWLSKFEYVLSGHYHLKSSADNIHYLGTQYQFSYSDVWDKKGFHVFDLSSNTLEFIENTDKKFYTVDYDETSDKKHDFELYRESFVKVFVKNKTTQAKFEKFLDKMYDVGVLELVVIDATVATATSDEAVDVQLDTLDLLHKEVEFAAPSLDKDRLHAIIDHTYHLALAEDNQE